ncbi:hypothetical protein PsAD2_02307 [Pseudovibrio axinellae]|uniref:DUF721 domain-containing protein n=2 Tax=Pseudovibrio axinellae TaxID=989403 RepID=A0A165YF81_9HYPH|nr:hypothetical protein PsAD2_02307 [Pseudovibrio axinellae]SEP92688.1 hypothetical protein SAMN05421798_101734 [Pseudovibrio axinellae]
MKATAQNRVPNRSSRQLNELIGKTMHPVARKRGFASADLLAAWPELVGKQYHGKVQPGRLVWPRTKSADGEPVAEPATLLVHSDGPTALFFTHEAPQLRSRINAFLGWNAVGRIKVVQRPALKTKKTTPKPLRELSEIESRRIEQKVADVSDDRLKAALEKLGKNIVARTPANNS